MEVHLFMKFIPEEHVLNDAERVILVDSDWIRQNGKRIPNIKAVTLR